MKTKNVMKIIPSEWEFIGSTGHSYFYQKKSDGTIIAEVRTDDTYWTYYYGDGSLNITDYIGDYQGVFGIFGAEDHYEMLYDGGRRENDENEINL